MATTYSGLDVNRVLLLVRDMSDDGNVQLSILVSAFTVACRSCGVDEETALAGVTASFAEAATLVPIETDHDSAGN